MTARIIPATTGLIRRREWRKDNGTNHSTMVRLRDSADKPFVHPPELLPASATTLSSFQMSQASHCSPSIAANVVKIKVARPQMGKALDRHNPVARSGSSCERGSISGWRDLLRYGGDCQTVFQLGLDVMNTEPMVNRLTESSWCDPYRTLAVSCGTRRRSKGESHLSRGAELTQRRVRNCATMARGREMVTHRLRWIQVSC